MVGATIDTADYLKGVYDVLGWSDIQRYGVGKGAWMFTATFLVWLAFLSALGGPLWRALHRRRVRNWPAAMLLGALLSFLLVLYVATGFGLSRRDAKTGFQAWEGGGPTYVDNVLTSHGWAVGLRRAGLFSLEGALVGLVVWRVAYRSRSIEEARS